MTLEDRIRALAHRIWEQEGYPHGRHEEHWQRACEQLGVPDLRNTANISSAASNAGPSPAGGGTLAGANETSDGIPDAMGVEDLNIGNLSDPSDTWPATGRSKLAGA